MPIIPITSLPELQAPAATDPLPIVDVAANATKKVAIGSVLKSAPAGTAAAPAFSFQLDPDTGIFSAALDSLSVSVAGAERFRFDNAGQLEALSVGSAGSPTYSFNGDPNTGIYSSGADQLSIATAGVRRININASGIVMVGSGTSRAINAINSTLQIESTSNGAGSSFIQNTNDANGPRLLFGKTRGTATGANTLVAAGDTLGTIVFSGADGTDLDQIGASVTAVVDGTPAANSLPTRLVFSTTTSGAAAPVEHYRITSEGVFCFLQEAPTAITATGTLTVLALKNGLITVNSATATTQTLPLGTDLETAFASPYLQMAFDWNVINTGTAAATIAAATGHTIVGAASIAANTSAHWRTVRTAANTFVSYRL